MAKKQGLSIELNSGWRQFHAWAAAFDGKLEIASKIALRTAVLFIMAEIVNKIEGREFKKLSPLTRFVRGLEGYSDIPLKRTGALVRSISTDVENAFVGHVGLLKKGKGGGRDPRSGRFTSPDFSNIGELLHDGGRVKITDAMRRSFIRHLGRQMSKQGVRLLNNRGSKKGVLRIPPRPFIKSVMEDPRVIAKVEAMYFQAIRAQTGM